MKKIEKILIALFLVVSLSCNSAVYASAAESGIGLSSDAKVKLNEQLYFAYLDAENLGISQDDFDELYIGNPIYSYECVGNSLKERDILMYPIFYGDKIILFMNKSEDGEENDINLTQCFAEELTEYYLSGEKIALVYDVEKCYVASENAIEELTSFGYQVDYRDSLSECEQGDIVLARIQPIEHVEYTGNKARASYAYLPVPMVSQNPPSYICWAASIACIGNYLTSQNYTAEDVARMIYGDSYNFDAGVGAAMDYMNSIYGIHYPEWKTTEVLSDNVMYYNLIDGYPIYAKWSTSGGTHATVIRGIMTDSYVMLMDPEYGFTVAYKSAGVYSYISNYSGTTLTLCGYGAKDIYVM